MSEIDIVLKKLTSISEAFNKAPKLADFVYQGSKKKYQTNLSKFAFQLNTDLAPISETKREIILKKWNKYLLGRNISFSLKEIEILSYENEVILKEQFWNLLFALEKISPKIIIGLVYSIHKSWKSVPNISSVLSFIATYILNSDSQNTIINCWKNNIDKIATMNAPNVLAELILSEKLDVSSIENTYYINLKTTDFGIEIHHIIIQKKISDYIKKRNIRLKNVQKIISEITNVFMDKKQSNYYYGLVINAVENSNYDKNLSKEYLKEFFIKSIDYRDPRSFPEKWMTFDPKYKKIFISWLNEQDIRTFFELFIDFDPHGRKDFWLKHLKNVRTTKIIQNPNLIQNLNNYSKIQQLKTKGVDIANIYDLRSNVFVLEFDKIIVVEFSEIGNACYIYDKAKMSIFNTTRNTYSKDELKNKSKTIITFSHYQNWKYDLSHWLSYYGVKN